MKAATIAVFGAYRLVAISIHAAREGGDGCTVPFWDCQHISIHAAREGGDEYRGHVMCKDVISIHAAREGGDED